MISQPRGAGFFDSRNDFVVRCKKFLKKECLMNREESVDAAFESLDVLHKEVANLLSGCNRIMLLIAKSRSFTEVTVVEHEGDVPEERSMDRVGSIQGLIFFFDREKSRFYYCERSLKTKGSSGRYIWPVSLLTERHVEWPRLAKAMLSSWRNGQKKRKSTGASRFLSEQL